MTDRERLLNHVAMGDALAGVDDVTKHRIAEIVADLERLAFLAGWDAHRQNEGCQLVDCYEEWQQRPTEALS